MLERAPSDDAVLAIIGGLFPFHLIVDPTPPHEVRAAGRSLIRWLGTELAGERVADRFELKRPRHAGFDRQSVARCAGQVVLIEDIIDNRLLRGQLLPLPDGSVAFLGSPQVARSDSFEQLGLTFADFAPHDATLDSIIYSQFTAIQVRDVETQQAALRAVSRDRDQFSELATTDDLTGLANRRAFWERCEQVASETSDSMSLLYIDVDGFKQINDEHGHHTGDQILCALADRMRSSLRNHDMVARIGGDEFVILVEHLDVEAAAGLAERLRNALNRPVETDHGLIPLTVSIGAADLRPGSELDDVVRDADTAMYRGRRQGRGRITWFDEQMGVERRDRIELTAELRSALDSSSIVPYFQPIVSLDARRVVAFEALARWSHAERGMVRPDIFVSVAEGAGLVEELDHHILRQSVAQAAEWSTRYDTPINIQVNVSGRTLGSRLPTHIAAALDESGLPANQLTIEVTESWFIGDDRIDVLDRIVEIGARLHLDDFGTGFSSLAHLQSFPIGGLKIDRSFVGQMASSTRSRRLVEATISMARSLQLDVVAEGVETETDAALLLGFGCEFAQGFLYSPAVPAAQAGELLAASVGGAPIAAAS